MNMQISGAGLRFIMAREGVRLVAYQDSVGVWTIGCGHTGRAQGQPVRDGDTCTYAQAMQWLRDDSQWAADAVNRDVKVPLTQHQFDALVDFVFNEGEGSFAGSTLLRLLNAGDYDGADAQFKRWNLAGGRVLAGLVTRRELEAEMFEEPDVSNSAA